MRKMRTTLYEEAIKSYHLLCKNTSLISPQKYVDSMINHKKLNYFQSNFFSIEAKNHIKPLPVIESFKKKFTHGFNARPLRKAAILYVHHPLKTSINVVDAMIHLGAEPKNIFVLGKSYSECRTVVKEMNGLGVSYLQCSPQREIGKFSMAFSYDILRLWSTLIANIGDNVEEIIIMDHGGHALTLMPLDVLSKYKVIGIEKTTAGLIRIKNNGIPLFPIVNVAGCSAKKILESPLIADAVVNKLTPFLLNKPIKMIPGVVGYGAIGKAITQKLLSIGHKKILVYDTKKITSDQINENIITTSELSALLAASDYIFGCSGNDITGAKEFFRLASSDKTLISCSSEDKEFLTLLDTIRMSGRQRPSSPFDDLLYLTDMDATIRIIRGGFPVNFDHTGESVPRNDIQLTRALTLAGIYQAIDILRDKNLLAQNKIIPLDPIKQKFIVNEWLKHQPQNRISHALIQEFKKSLNGDSYIDAIDSLSDSSNYHFLKNKDSTLQNKAKNSI